MTDAAVAIIDVADSAMVQANRLMTVRRGLDPRRFDLIAFGGAGPLHACSQATALGFRSVIVPPAAGVLSAFGLLASVPRVDHRTAFRRRLDRVAAAELSTPPSPPSRRRPSTGCRPRPATAPCAGSAPRTCATSASRGTCASRSRPGPWTRPPSTRLRQDFDAAHERAYGYCSPDAPIEIVHLAVDGLVAAPAGRRGRGRCRRRPAPVRTPRAAGARHTYVDARTGWTERAGVRPGVRCERATSLTGPALIDGAGLDDLRRLRGFDGRIRSGGLLHLVPRPTGD